MSSNFHTPFPTPVVLTSSNLESPLSELDQAITNFRDGGNGFIQLNLKTFNSKTIASGAITGDKTLVTIDTEASAASDDLDTISSPGAGDLMIMKIANNSRVVTIRHNGGGGNIRTWNGANVILTDTNQLVTLLYNGSNWIVLPDNSQITSYTAQSATISGGAITFTSTVMTLDTEASAASDNLDTINGGINGAFLIIKTANSSRDIVVRHNVGNIYLSSGVNITLSNTDEYLFLVYNSATSKWNGAKSLPVVFTSAFGSSSFTTSSNEFSVPFNSLVDNNQTLHPLASTTVPYFDILPANGLRQSRALAACNTTLEGYGFGTLTVSGTPSNNYGAMGSEAPGSVVRFQSGASSGNLGGVVSPFFLTSNDCAPYLRIVFKTYSSIAVCRFWIGLSSAAIGNTDSPSGASTHFMGIRYSTVAADSFWTFVTSDGSTTTASAGTITPATDTSYELVLTSDGSAIQMYLREFGTSTYDSYNTSTTTPTSGTPLGLNARVETREAVAKSLQIYGVALYH